MSNTSINVNKLFYLGRNEINQPVFINYAMTNRDRNSYNKAYIGTIGSGKSVKMKSDLDKSIRANNSINHVIDPQGEYATMAANHKGKVIKYGTSNQIWNPFQVIITNSKDDDATSYTSIKNPFRQQLIANSVFIADIFELDKNNDTHKMYLNIFNDIQRIVYASKKIDESTNFKKLKAKDYPIFDDFFNQLNKEINNEIKHIKDEKKNYDTKQLELLKSLKYYMQPFCNDGAFNHFFNGYSTIDVANENFVVWDISEVVSTGLQDSVLAGAILYIIMRFSFNFMVENGNRANFYYNLWIDELHLVVTRQNSNALKEVETFSRINRKKNASVNYALQSFTAMQEGENKEVFKVLIDMTQYKFFFSLGDNDIRTLRELLFGTNNELTESEIEHINAPESGRALFIASSKDHRQLYVDLGDLTNYKKSNGARMYELEMFWEYDFSNKTNEQIQEIWNSRFL